MPTELDNKIKRCGVFPRNFGSDTILNIMKQTNTLEKIKKIEKELVDLKISLRTPKAKTADLFGIWKEIQITEKDIEEAKFSFSKFNAQV